MEFSCVPSISDIRRGKQKNKPKNLTKQILSVHELFSANENALIRSHNGGPLKWHAILKPLIYISDLGRASVMQDEESLAEGDLQLQEMNRRWVEADRLLALKKAEL